MTWIRDKWDERKGRGLSVDATLLDEVQSDFQNIAVYNSKAFGKMLLLDGVINVTEFDEFAYHEMLVHVPLTVHPNPKKVLVIGGGDGGTVRELLKHYVEEIHVCEIDKEVVSIAKKHFPSLAQAFDDPKVTIFHEDGAKFIKNKQYDIILVDSSDPWGPAEALFTEEFYSTMHNALADNGIAVTQSEAMFYDKELIQKIQTFSKKIFPIVHYYYTMVPTYPSGSIGFSFCSKGPQHKAQKNVPNCTYYTKEIHDAAFILPKFM
ncbi:MAG: polyamine aminopropyltransferase [Candidatus Woesearchaeota archaeon]|nr:polyamine aminopropyltransferase [Candidatus Woesearchaeota archaeon]